MKKWQLKRLSTGEALNEPQDLPDNWKNISSLKGSIDRLNDLAWAGHPDMGWFEVDVLDPAVDIRKSLWMTRLPTSLWNHCAYGSDGQHQHDQGQAPRVDGLPQEAARNPAQS
jgi:hypothetical protein